MPQNRRTDNRPDLYLFAKPLPCDEPRVAPSIRTWVSVFPNSTPPRHGMAKLATFSLASATMQSGLGTCVRAHPTHSRPPIYVTAGWIIMCASARSAVVVAHPPRFDLSCAVCGVKRSYLRIHVYAHATHTREIAPIHLLPPRRKSHRINVRDQRLSISYRAFLSISAAAYNDGDSKAADYEINARLATLTTFARARGYDLSVLSWGRRGGEWLFATRELPPFAPRRRVSRRRWHFRYPSIDRSDFRRNTSAIQKFTFNFALNMISLYNDRIFYFV